MAAAGLVLVLGGCAGVDSLVQDAAPGTGRVNLGEFMLEPLARAWTAQIDAIVLAQRRLSGERQQLIGLANDTALRGDNFILLVAYGSPERVPSRFRLRDVVRRIGDIPYPFANLSDNELRQARDRLGVFFWKEVSVPGRASCVLAIRRLDYASRMLPDNTAAMEVVLRNCVTGEVETALAPIRPDSLAVSFQAAAVNGSVHPRVLNPLAAPQP